MSTKPCFIGKEISLDLGGFQHSSRSIDPFLRMIKSSSTNITTNAVELKVEFESTLRYVDIPIPDLPEAQAGGMKNTDRSEARVILEWLRTKKEVTGIYELRVRDSLFFPHSEEAIAQCLNGFDVEILDWMRVDMSVKPLLNTCRNLKKLMLYAGNWATLSYWTSKEAIDALSEFSAVCLQLKAEPAIAKRLIYIAKGSDDSHSSGELRLESLVLSSYKSTLL